MGADSSMTSTAAATPAVASTSPDPQTPGSTPARSARIGWYVIIGAIVVGSVMGVFLFTRAKDSDIAIRQWMATYKERGPTLSGTACVSDVLAWFHESCDAPIEMCIQAVPMAVGHCLKTIDRSEDCKAIGTELKPDQWSFKKCQEAGVDRKSKKPLIKACTAAWDALDTFCRSGQRGVAL